MVDGMPLARRRLAALGENPHTAVVDPVNSIFQQLFSQQRIINSLGR